MGTRLELHAVLKSVLGSDHVYFQPPEDIRMVYPCIVYNRDDLDTFFADDYPYAHRTQYSVIVIDPNPDSEIPQRLKELQLCRFDRFYAVDNLNHDAFKLFF